jgi:glycosyltransferase involved in cell wall biosynthesis
MKHSDSEEQRPLVSVIIPCYNHGRFLAEAIESVRRQTYTRYEIVVVDDGSSDNTAEVSTRFPEVKYVHQANAGLSAARNTGVEKSNGKFLVFLDADDWLYDDAIESNLTFFRNREDLAFVSGWHTKVDEWNCPLEMDEQVVVASNHYENLLRGNYIGMHAAVMYARWVFTEFEFDTALKACEDYDLYFKITRRHPVVSHNKTIAAYRIHGKNMSSRIPFMLEHVLKVCDRQKSLLKNEDERKAYHQGIEIWKNYYGDQLLRSLFGKMKHEHQWGDSTELSMLLKNAPVKFARYFKSKIGDSVRQNLKHKLPDTVLKSLHHAGIYEQYTPKPGHVNPGDFERATPFSYDFGFDRGGAIDRFYIEHFLEENAHLICGTVLEIGDNEYTLKYGGDKVKKSDILHVDSKNPRATYVGDITDVPQIETNSFDCIILTQTLHLIYDFHAALKTCFRILKPGGTLLLTVPGISHIDHGEWKDYWLWSFTDKSMHRLMLENFDESQVEIQTYGNVYVAAAFLYGMGLPEFNKEFLSHHDPSYQVIISVKATKA